MTPDRILFAPEAADEGSAADAGMVTIAAPELEALRAAAALASRADADREEAIREDRRRLDEELGRISKKAEEWERACKGALREKELAAALAGRPLVQGAASQLIRLWREELEVVDEAGGLRVAARDGRPVAEAVASWLASPEYAHFSRPPSRGGTAPPGDSRSTAAAPSTPRPRTLGDAALLRWQEAAQAAQHDPATPIGLGRRRS